ncbi:hypothetical protein QZH41_019977 [Actinostola sp. cb2023]|nr:hypothetical protein QZH41_019977 [Actinostola sp. cb2023]
MDDIQDNGLSAEWRPFEHQVAGHICEEGSGMLTNKDGTVLKPVQIYPKGEREVTFYEQIFKKEIPRDEVLALRSFLPQYHGIVKLLGNKESEKLGILLFISK